MAFNQKPTSAAAKSAAAPTTKHNDENKALRIVAKRDGFRRAGRVFGSEHVDIPLTEISEGEYLALTTEPMLVTYLVDIPQADAKDTSAAG